MEAFSQLPHRVGPGALSTIHPTSAPGSKPQEPARAAGWLPIFPYSITEKVLKFTHFINIIWGEERSPEMAKLNLRSFESGVCSRRRRPQLLFAPHTHVVPITQFSRPSVRRLRHHHHHHRCCYRSVGGPLSHQMILTTLLY